MDGMLESGAGRGAKRIVALGVAAGGILGLAAVAAVLLTVRPLASADKTFWTVSGPPCPAATQAELDRIGRPLAQVVDFGNARFARVSGAVECNDMTGALGLVTGSACQFNRPRALAVWSRGGTGLYQFPGGQAATVTVSDSRPPRCVMATHYKGE